MRKAEYTVNGQTSTPCVKYPGQLMAQRVIDWQVKNESGQLRGDFLRS